MADTPLLRLSPLSQVYFHFSCTSISTSTQNNVQIHPSLASRIFSNFQIDQLLPHDLILTEQEANPTINDHDHPGQHSQLSASLYFHHTLFLLSQILHSTRQQQQQQQRNEKRLRNLRRVWSLRELQLRGLSNLCLFARI